jgi:hypothetical protein
MASPKQDFPKEEAELRAKLDDPEAWDALLWLAQLEADWARAIAKAKPAKRAQLLTAMRATAKRGTEPKLVLEAAEHLAKAERWQAKYASGASGGGEGLGRWYGLLELRLARAWLYAGTADVPAIRKLGRELCKQLDRDREDSLPERRRDLDALKRIFR